MQGIRTGAFLPPEAFSDVTALAAAAAHAVALARSGDSRKGLALALRARQQARGLEIERGELQALNAAAIVHAMRGDHIAAVAAGIDAWELARRLGERSVMGHALVTLSQSAHNLGALPEARGVLEGCVAQALRDRDPDLEVRARSAVGIVLGDSAEFDAAEGELARALFLVQYHRKATLPSRIMANYANLRLKRARRLLATGHEAEGLADCHKARNLAAHAFTVATGEPNVPVRIDALAIQGRAEGLAREPRAALEHLAGACEIGVSARCRTPLPWILCERGRIHLALGEIDAARKAYETALEIAQDLRPSMKIEDACAGLARVDQAAGDEVGARRWAVRAAIEADEFDQVRGLARNQLAAFFTER